MDEASKLVDKVIENDDRSLSRLITIIETNSKVTGDVLKKIHASTGNAYTIGVTGPPGAGKSTLVDQMTAAYRANQETVGILAVDPTSPFTGGAFLGDRIRMQQHYLDSGVFIRSIATRASGAGLSATTRTASKLLDASGKDIVIIETVGVGQSELEIMEIADTVVVVLVPEAGDVIQALKAGLGEVADIFVVNKADREGAGLMLTNLEASFNLSENPNWWRPPVILTKANVGEGVEQLCQAIGNHRKILSETNRLSEKRKLRRKQDLFKSLDEKFREWIRELVKTDNECARILKRVEDGKSEPYTAAQQILQKCTKD